MLYVGRLVPEKGVEMLLDAWEAARHDWEVLCLAGEGPLRGRRAGPTWSSRRSRRPRSRCPPPTRPRTWSSFRRSRRGRSSSRGDSSATRRCTRAVRWSPRRPSARRRAASCETARPAWSFPTADPVALAGAIRGLLGDLDLRERLGARARAAVADFSHEAAADAFGEALRAVGAGGIVPNIPRRWASRASRSSHHA